MGKRIACLAEMFYQFDLRTFLAGGGERYFNDFITILKNLGYTVDIYQFSHEKMTVRYKNHRIYGLGNVKPHTEYEICAEQGVKQFYDLTKDYDGVFLLSMNLSRFVIDKPTLTISHGLWWDCHEDKPQLAPNMMKLMKKWIANANLCISVDTNSIHAMQLYNPKESRKMMYVPNYVDMNVFKQKEKDYTGRFKVLFARRIDPARGYKVAVKAAQILTKKYENIDFVFCGKGHPFEEDALKSMIKDYPNMKLISADQNEMHKVYDDAHISWIPTVKAEGTSLTCLESLACGVTPIVSTIGGLTDLVQPQINGLMIAPDSVDELVFATEYLYNNHDELKRMRSMGLEMIKGFSKDRWDKQITSIVKSLYGEP